MSTEELRNLVAQLQTDLMETLRQKEEGQGQIQRLQHKLEATENTVRHISRKLKFSRPLTADCNYSPTPMAAQCSRSEVTLHRGDHWSRIYQGMLNDSSNGCGSPGFWYGGPMKRSVESQPYFNNTGGFSHHDISNNRAKSLSGLASVNKPAPTPSSPKLQKVKTLSSSCILSPRSNQSDDETRPVPFMRFDEEKTSGNSVRGLNHKDTKNTATNDANENLKSTPSGFTATALTNSNQFSNISPENACGISNNYDNQNNKCTGRSYDQPNIILCPSQSVTFQQHDFHQQNLPNISQQDPLSYPGTIHHAMSTDSSHANKDKTNSIISTQKQTSFTKALNCGFNSNYTTTIESGNEKAKNISNLGDLSFPSGSKPETEILTQLQRLLGEKEEMWRTKTTEIKNRMKKENFLLMQENELLHEEVKLLQENVNSQNKTINELKQVVEAKSEDQRKLVDEINTLKLEKTELEEELANQDKELTDLDKSLSKLEITKKESDIQKKKKMDELEENKRELNDLKKELEHYRETNTSLKDSLIKREASLQEQIFTVRKLRAERNNDSRQPTMSRTPDIIKTDADFQRANSPTNGKLNQTNVDSHLQINMAHFHQGQHELLRNIAELKVEVKMLQEEKVTLNSEKERAKANFNLQIAEMDKQLTDKLDLENRLAQAEFELKSNKGLDEEIASFRSQLDKKFRNEMKMRSRIAEGEAAVMEERKHLLATERDLKEKSDKLKKRDKQCQELCEKFGKLDAAYIKQTRLLREKTDVIETLKKRIQLYEDRSARKYSSMSSQEKVMGSKL